MEGELPEDFMQPEKESMHVREEEAARQMHVPL